MRKSSCGFSRLWGFRLTSRRRWLLLRACNKPHFCDGLGNCEGFVFLDGEADCAAELLTIKRILDRLALCIGRGRIERHSRLQRLTKRKWVAGIHRIITEKAVETAMHVVGAGFRHNVDGCATGPTEFGGIVAAVDQIG